MNIDITTLLVCAGAVVAVAGVSFILSTALRRNERHGRLWSIAFIAGILETVSAVVWGLSPSGWWASAVSNGALVLALAFMWAGCREYNGRRAFAWIAVTAGVVVAGAGLAEGPQGGYWAGAEVLFVAVAVFGALAGIETVRGNLRRNVDARVLTFVFFGVGIYYFFRLIVFVAAGETSEAFTVYFGTQTTTLAAIVLVIVAAIAMTAVQPDDESRTRDSASSTRARSIPGVTDAAQFENQANDWLSRARRDKYSLVLLTMSVDGIEHITSAFGREFGAQTIYTVGRIACEHSPAAAIVGQTGEDRFMILTTAPSVGSPIAIAERLQTALVETPVDAAKGIRAIATFGIATTVDVGFELTALATAAASALKTAQAGDKPGAIALAG